MGVIEAYRISCNPVVIPCSVTVFKNWASFILESNCLLSSQLSIGVVSYSRLVQVFFLESKLFLLAYSLCTLVWGLSVAFPFFLSLAALGWILKLNHCLILSKKNSITISMPNSSWLDHLTGVSDL